MRRHAIASAVIGGLTALCLVAHPSHAQTPELDVTVRALMTSEEFQAAGLEKLTEAELAALDEWFLTTLMTLMRGPAGGDSPAGTSFRELEGGMIIADDGEFLGRITTNCLDRQSIGNEIGPHGSSVGRASIFNDVGRYGGRVSVMSPFNRLSTSPPRIYLNGEFVAYLTVNQLSSPRIDPNALVGWIRSVC